MTERLPDPPVDRTGWWRGPPAPPNPDDLGVKHGRRPVSVARAVALGWMAMIAVIAGLVAAALIGGPIGDGAADAFGTLLPLLFLAGFGGVVVALVWGFVYQLGAGRRAREAAMRIEEWAQRAGLTYRGSADLPEATPLLCRGDRRYARNLAVGELPGGVPGILAGYVYEEEQGDDNSKTTEYPHTVVVARLPETLGFLGELTVEPRDRFDPFGRIGDRLRKRRRVEFESIELDRLFEVTVPRDADDNWVRQLFSPSFVATLLPLAS